MPKSQDVCIQRVKLSGLISGKTNLSRSIISFRFPFIFFFSELITCRLIPRSDVTLPIRELCLGAWPATPIGRLREQIPECPRFPHVGILAYSPSARCTSLSPFSRDVAPHSDARLIHSPEHAGHTKRTSAPAIVTHHCLPRCADRTVAAFCLIRFAREPDFPGLPSRERDSALPPEANAGARLRVGEKLGEKIFFRELFLSPLCPTIVDF